MTKDQVAELIEQIPQELTPDEFLVALATKAEEAEREACADIAENWNCNGFPRVGVAEAIRARGEK